MRLTESKLFDDLEVIMTVQKRRTQRRTEREIKRHGEWCGRVKEKGLDGQTSGRRERSRLLIWQWLKTVRYTVQKLEEIKTKTIISD